MNKVTAFTLSTLRNEEILGMSLEIAEKLKVVGATIHYRRTSSLKELKLRLEVKEDGQSAE